MQDLITFLHADGLITRSECAAIKKTSRDLRENPVRVLRSLNVAAPEDIQRCFKVYFNYPLVTDALVSNLTGEYAALIPVDLALHFSVFGFGQEGDSLHVGMEDPTDRATIEALKFFLGKEILPSAANVYQLTTAMAKLYGVAEGASGLETVIDQARGAGAWSQTEREMFEKILEERRIREQEVKKSVTFVSASGAEKAPIPRTDLVNPAKSAETGSSLAKSPESSGFQSTSEDSESTAGGSLFESEDFDFDGMDDKKSALPDPDSGEDDGFSDGTLEQKMTMASDNTVADDSMLSHEELLASVETDSLPEFDEDSFESDSDTGVDGFEFGELEGQSEIPDILDAPNDPVPTVNLSVSAVTNLVQKALLKVSLCAYREAATSAANAVLGAETISIESSHSGPIQVYYQGTMLTENQLNQSPWSSLGVLLRALEKKAQSNS